MNATKDRLVKQIEGAKLNPNTTDTQFAQLQTDLRSVEDALSEMEGDQTTTVADLETKATEAKDGDGDLNSSVSDLES
eukprot:COSAG05_NODE_412_length_10089_cov_13.887287_9_plen_78_part_00